MTTDKRKLNVVAHWVAANGQRRSAIYIVREDNEVAAVRSARELLILDEGRVRAATFRTVRAR